MGSGASTTGGFGFSLSGGLDMDGNGYPGMGLSPCSSNLRPAIRKLKFKNFSVHLSADLSVSDRRTSQIVTYR